MSRSVIIWRKYGRDRAIGKRIWKVKTAIGGVLTIKKPTNKQTRIILPQNKRLKSGKKSAVKRTERIKVAGVKFLRALCATAMLFTISFAEDSFLDKECEKAIYYDIGSGYMLGYNCIFAKQDIEETYQSFKTQIVNQYPENESYKRLRSSLESGKDYTDRFGDELQISYKWKSRKELGIVIEDLDSVIEIDLTQNDKGTELNYYLYR